MWGVRKKSIARKVGEWGEEKEEGDMGENGEMNAVLHPDFTFVVENTLPHSLCLLY